MTCDRDGRQALRARPEGAVRRSSEIERTPGHEKYPACVPERRGRRDRQATWHEGGCRTDVAGTATTRRVGAAYTRSSGRISTGRILRPSSRPTTGSRSAHQRPTRLHRAGAPPDRAPAFASARSLPSRPSGASRFRVRSCSSRQ